MRGFDVEHENLDAHRHKPLLPLDSMATLPDTRRGPKGAATDLC